jgi:hypothetical protein
MIRQPSTNTKMNFSHSFTLRPAVIGFAAVAILSAVSAQVQVTVLSGPVGVMSTTPPLHKSPVAHPLIAEDLFVGIASGNAGWEIEFPAEEGNIGESLAEGGRYYVEIVTGPLEGERLDVDTAATIAAAGASIIVDLGDESFSTLSQLNADALADARCVIRPHLTLSRLQALLEPGLSGTDKGRSGDAVWVQGPLGLERFQLAGDGESWIESVGNGGGKWAGIHNRWLSRDERRSKAHPGDFRDMVIPPDVGVMLELMSGPKEWRHEGIVRTNAFRKNLVKGYQGFATGFPVWMSPVDVAAFVDAGEPAGWQWTGDNKFAKADQFQVFAIGAENFSLYYLRADGSAWARLDGNPKTDYAGEPIFGPAGMVVLWRSKPNPEFVIPVPFEL